MSKETNVEGLYLLNQKLLQTQYGFEIVPDVLTTATKTLAITLGHFIYCIKPIGGNVTITSAKDIFGNAIVGLAGQVFLQGDEFKFPLTEIIFTGTLAIYYQVKLNNYIN